MSEQPTLKDMLARIQRLPALPAVALELLNTLSGSDPDVTTLARRIAQDQAIAARVLRVANSPFYGLQSRVGSIHDAVVRWSPGCPAAIARASTPIVSGAM